MVTDPRPEVLSCFGGQDFLDFGPGFGSLCEFARGCIFLSDL